MRKEDLRAEALQRMIFMRMKPEIIRNFSSGKLMKTDLNGTLQSVTEDEQKRISDWEEKRTAWSTMLLKKFFMNSIYCIFCMSVGRRRIGKLTKKILQTVKSWSVYKI